jgi:co-chaperonin GroES (HSP10)
MTLTPLADRVLIRPEAQPTMTQSGLHLMEHYKPEQVGEVVAVGMTAHPRKAEAFMLAKELDFWPEPEAGIAAQLLRDLTGREPEVKVGDTVLFSWNVGQEIWVNDGDQKYLLMRHDDILAVIDYE